LTSRAGRATIAGPEVAPNAVRSLQLHRQSAARRAPRSLHRRG